MKSLSIELTESQYNDLRGASVRMEDTPIETLISQAVSDWLARKSGQKDGRSRRGYYGCALDTSPNASDDLPICVEGPFLRSEEAKKHAEWVVRTWREDVGTELEPCVEWEG